MQLQIDIGFEQLVQLGSKLNVTQWTKLKKEVDRQKATDDSNTDLKSFLLKGPTFANEQLTEIENARKEINTWRQK